jgi:hypothetical protein
MVVRLGSSCISKSPHKQVEENILLDLFEASDLLWSCFGSPHRVSSVIVAGFTVTLSGWKLEVHA